MIPRSSHRPAPRNEDERSNYSRSLYAYRDRHGKIVINYNNIILLSSRIISNSDIGLAKASEFITTHA